MKITETEEYKRLGEQTDDCGVNEWSRWKKWGPYVSNRQWGTVREQYTLGQPRQSWKRDEAWTSLFYDEADKTAYRWGEDGIFGISDDEQRLCFALALWNGKDPHLKERFYGLPGIFGGYTTDAKEKKAKGCAGSHGEDVKEYYFYLDNTPSHSYMKARYKYPFDTFPYDCLRDRNETCDKDLPEFDILDTGVFDKDNYSQITVEYAKKAWNDICIRIIVKNCGPVKADTLHVLPQLWFRNTWSSGKNPAKPPVITRQARGEDDKGFAQVIADDGQSEASIISNKMALYCKGKCELLFTDNETRPDVLRPSQPASANGFYKDNIGRHVCRRPADSDRPAPVRTDYGTKYAADYQVTELEPGKTKTIELRLTAQLDHESPFSEEFDTIFETRRDEADRFYDAIFWGAETETEQYRPFKEKGIDIKDMTKWKQVQRQALAGLLWSKQFYQYNVSEWLRHRVTLGRCREECGWKELNSRWGHLNIAAIMLVPDKWEYPYFATWDSAFQAVAMALIDPKYAKEELLRFTDVSLTRYDGQMPGCEFGFDDVHPPIHAWAAWKVYETEKKLYGRADRDFLDKIVWRLWTTLRWWRDNKRVVKSVNKDGKTIPKETDLYRGGFLGLDNVSLLDRNQFDRDGGKREVFIEQADASGWMGLFSLMMLKIAIEVGDVRNDDYKTMAKEAFDCFWETTKAINRVSDPSAVPEWNMHDYWYYDVLRIQLPSFAMEIPLQYCSIIGAIPLLANECLQASQWSQSSHAFMEYVGELFDKRVNEDCNLEGEERHAWKKGSKDGAAIWLTMVDRKKLFTMMDKLLDKQEFLSPYGIRSLSKRHRDAPYRLDGVLTNEYGQPFPIEVKYEPGEAVGRKVEEKAGRAAWVAHVFGGGNSNWRGPVWFPINFLVFDMLQKRHKQFAATGEGGIPIKRPYPTLSEDRKTFNDIAIDLGTRLVRLFCLDDETGVMPAHEQDHRSRMRFSKNKSPEEGSKGETQAGWSDLILFYEYFNGDNGSGLGASHQTGWTALVANIIHDVITLIAASRETGESSRQD